jgi:hypothetical protein
VVDVARLGLGYKYGCYWAGFGWLDPRWDGLAEVRVTKVRREGPVEIIEVRCFAFPHDGQVIARCIDLDLAVVRPTLAQARQELEHQISGYLDAVLSRGWRDRISRPAPLSVFALYYLVFAVSRTRSAFRWLRTTGRTSAWMEHQSLAAPA